MANLESHNLPVLELELHQVKEALRCVLHTIVFNRALGFLAPVEVDSDVFDVTYVKCGDEVADKQIEAKLVELCTVMERQHRAGAGPQQVPEQLMQVTLSFYERRKKQAWFGSQDERLYWEQWIINICLVPQQLAAAATSTSAAQRLARLQKGMEELIAYVVLCVNEKKDHIPPVVSQSALTYAFDIALVGTSAGRGASALGLNAVKKLLLQATPPPVLS